MRLLQYNVCICFYKSLMNLSVLNKNILCAINECIILWPYPNTIKSIKNVK